jgi:phage regulator Rha-like protein
LAFLFLEIKKMSKLSVNVKSMSSLEIAELTGKEHRNVMSDIRKMLEELKIDAAKFSATYKTGRNNTYECFNLPKDETITLISGYSAVLRMAIIKRWSELEQKELLENERKASRQQARLEAPLMTKALQDARARLGKESPPHVFSNDYDMIYRIVLGLPAKKYKLENGIDDKENLRDVLSLEQIKAVESLQRLNQSMLELDFDFETRKKELNRVFMRDHAKPMIDEIIKDNS